jgi:hypothetical protein
MAACGTSGLFGGRFVVLPVADNSLMAAVPVFALAVVFLEVAFFATGFFVSCFLDCRNNSPLFDFHFLGKYAIYDSDLYFFRVPDLW